MVVSGSSTNVEVLVWGVTSTIAKTDFTVKEGANTITDKTVTDHGDGSQTISGKTPNLTADKEYTVTLTVGGKQYEAKVTVDVVTLTMTTIPGLPSKSEYTFTCTYE